MIINSQTNENVKNNLYSTTQFNPDNYDLVFTKPVFDIAFILTHESLVSKINQFQTRFQSKHRFTTNSILLEDSSKFKFCLDNLKTQDIYYAIVLHENSEVFNFFDLYILHCNEVFKQVSIEKIDVLITNDFKNLMNKVKILKKTPMKSPHPVNENIEGLHMSDDLRYYLCLLFDNRTLKLSELKCVYRYLLHRKQLLEKSIEANNDFFGEHPFESSNKDKLKYYVFEPSHCNLSKTEISNNDDQNNSILPSKFVFKGPNRSSSIISLSDKTQSPQYKIMSPNNYDNSDNLSGIFKDFKLFKSDSLQRTFQFSEDKKLSKIKDNYDDIRGKRSINNDCKSETNKFNIEDSPKNKFRKEELFKHSTKRYEYEKPSYKKPAINKADLVQQKFSSISEKIKKVERKTCVSSQVNLYLFKARISNNPSIKKDNSTVVNYTKSVYYKRAMAKSSNLINGSDVKPEMSKSNRGSLTSGNFVVDLTDDVEDNTVPNNKKKRKLNDTESQRKSKKTNLIQCTTSEDETEVNNVVIYQPVKSCPESLFNLFRLVLNLVPLRLPNENAIYQILINSSVTIQEGIIEPALKNVKIDYETCKTNGVTEIITNIYSIFNESKKSIGNTTFINFIWNKYFPIQTSIFNSHLMIVFYRFVKLLMLYTMFNKSQATKKLVLTVIEQVNVIVNFDFNSPILYQKSQTFFFSKTFHKYFKEHDQLHILYSHLSKSKPLPLTDKSKRLDIAIKKKKIEYTIGPLLNYFVISINSINSVIRKMAPYQIEIIYGAIRTLRFCLRKINPKLVQTIFNSPKSFDFSAERSNTHYQEILTEIQLLLTEIKHYQCILFTDMHYEFVNCLLDFSWMIESNIDIQSLSSETNNLLLDPMQFVDSFVSFDSPILLPYFNESELEYLKESLRKRWTDILYKAFIGTKPEPCGWRIIKEMTILLPELWGLMTFNEAITDSAKMYYTNYKKLSISDPSGWYGKYRQTKLFGSIWLAKFHLPTTNLEVFNNYQMMLESMNKS